ncbi:PREDICTED: actin, aortic smooth muscle-like [Mandrillus leucophaeus]|uniref:actin, aortic smooth muscle-like n=1 Tax=Mandrillus leucophaeus TaxID=9568 RepID=UPI0005F40CB3|nr:PREDICTED: actin, aortic smooth muscle-like [Mandrillus leucophaeus]
MDSVPLICDYGSGFSKVGFAGMESPMGVFPTVLGKLRHDGDQGNPLSRACRIVNETRRVGLGPATFPVNETRRAGLSLATFPVGREMPLLPEEEPPAPRGDFSNPRGDKVVVTRPPVHLRSQPMLWIVELILRKVQSSVAGSSVVTRKISARRSALNSQVKKSQPRRPGVSLGAPPTPRPFQGLSLAAKTANVLVGMEEEDWFIGEEVQKNRGKLILQYPISRATMTNWDNMEKIWHHSFYQVLHVAPEQHPVLVTEPPLNPTPSKQKVTQVSSLSFLLGLPTREEVLVCADRVALMGLGSGARQGPALEKRGRCGTLLKARVDHRSGPRLGCVDGVQQAPAFRLLSAHEAVLFETFNIPALYLANQGVLSLYASGQTSGLTVESGEGMTHFVPIADGCPLRLSTFQLDIAGQDLTLHLLQLLKDNGQLLLGTGDREYIRDMKEKCCYVALDFDKEKKKTYSPSHHQKYQLPDGQEITVGQESFFCPEALFQTKLIGRDTPGIHTMAIQSITSCSPDLQNVLFGHMLLSGGTGSCPGLRFRMQREISELVSPTVHVKPLLWGLWELSLQGVPIELALNPSHITSWPWSWLQIPLANPASFEAGHCKVTSSRVCSQEARTYSLLPTAPQTFLEDSITLSPIALTPNPRGLRSGCRQMHSEGKVATCPYSVYGAWVGGSILCSLSTFKDMWVTGKEYKEMGSSIVSRKSF